jgi:biotin operon repressor
MNIKSICINELGERYKQLKYADRKYDRRIRPVRSSIRGLARRERSEQSLTIVNRIVLLKQGLRSPMPYVLTHYYGIQLVLRQSDRPLSRVEIARKLNTTRDAVWAPLKRLIDEGKVVGHPTNYCYRLRDR